MNQTEVANGSISFDSLEQLIMTHIHNNWDSRRGVNSLDPDSKSDANAVDTEEFEPAGELYRLEKRDGKRFPVKVARPPPKLNVSKDFKGRCFKCDRVGHMGRDCKFSTKADGKPLNHWSTHPPTLHTPIHLWTQQAD